MALQLFCPTEHAALLVGVPSEQGTFHFPTRKKTLPGIWLRVKPRLAINPQLIEAVETELGLSDLAHRVTINQQFAAKLTNELGQPASLFVATLDAGVTSLRPEWLTLPQLLRQMPKDRNRLPYLLAWQVLSGGLAQEVQALEVDEQFVPIDRSPKGP